MAKLNSTTISRRTVERLAADRDTVYWDSELLGFGVRVYPTGGKVYGEGVVGGNGEALADGEDVRPPGFGTFGTRSRPARTGRNPRTGEAVSISASTSATFKVGKTLRDTRAPPGCSGSTIQQKPKLSLATRSRTSRLPMVPTERAPASESEA